MWQKLLAKTNIVMSLLFAIMELRFKLNDIFGEKKVKKKVK